MWETDESQWASAKIGEDLRRMAKTRKLMTTDGKVADPLKKAAVETAAGHLPEVNFGRTIKGGLLKGWLGLFKEYK